MKISLHNAISDLTSGSKKNEATRSHNPFSSAQEGKNPFSASSPNPFVPAQMKKEAAIQRESLPEEEEMQMKAKTLQRQPEEEEMMQAKMPGAESSTSTATTSTQGLPTGVQSHMEQALQADFSGVKIHQNSPQADSVGALAYTQGTDIHFAPGKFDTGSTSGLELLGHELNHVKQQSEGRVSPTGQVNGLPLNDDPALEQESDQMGQKAAQMMKDKQA